MGSRRIGTAPDSAPGGESLPAAESVLVVCAHPDDESFGLGALLGSFAEAGASVAVLCLTRGEASTLGVTGASLGALRSAELTQAAAVLGVRRVELLDHPDGSLASVPLGRLAGAVAAMAGEVRADLLVVFDDGGITGHPDHCRATEAALAGAPDLPALAWTLPHRVADALNDEFGTAFVGRLNEEIDLTLRVDRSRQRRAIECHASQCGDNPVLHRRLSLLGDAESMRWLRPPTPGEAREAPGESPGPS